MSKIEVITHNAFALHHVPEGHPERPDRIRHVWQALDEDFADLTQHQAPLATAEDIARVHGDEYLETLTHQEPQDGLISLDADTFMGRGSLEASRRAAGGAVMAVDRVMTGQAERVFLAARPPGHHAEPNKPMGFCLFSSAAIAAEYARAEYGLTRVAVVDFDVHHGNGTQAAFWDDGDLLFASSHQMPLYPGSGSVDETGCGNIFNAPMRSGDDGHAVIAAWQDHLIPQIKGAKPELIILSAGFDAHADDPLANLNLQSEDFATLTTMIRQMAEDVAEGRLISLLEGGYNLNALKESVTAHLNAMR